MTILVPIGKIPNGSWVVFYENFLNFIPWYYTLLLARIVKGRV